MQMEHFCPQIQVKTKKKKVFNKNRILFSPKFTFRCIPIQIVAGDADVDHSQTIVGDAAKLLWGYIPPSPPLVSAPLMIVMLYFAFEKLTR